VNGVAVSEFLLNAYAAGELDVPVILVAGEAQLQRMMLSNMHHGLKL